ncbi:MAG: hypothetical protein JSS34_05240 [Proteobacteria bacterium]|nr:hypothetical protein [Pseudomonadota bacterium]
MIPQSFFILPFQLISFYDPSQNNSDSSFKEAYETTLLKIFLQGNLKESGLDLCPYAEKYPSLYILSKLKKNTLKPLCYIKFVTNPSSKLTSISSAFFYMLTEQNSSLSHLEAFSYSTLKNFSSFNPFFKRPPLVLNLYPLEGILLNIPESLVNIFEQNSPSSLSIFSSYIRSTTGLWFGRRLLTLLEDVFPKIFYTSFNFSQETLLSSRLISEAFLWILQEWGYLSFPLKTSFLRRFLTENFRFSKKSSSPLKIKSKSFPTFEKKAPSFHNK